MERKTGLVLHVAGALANGRRRDIETTIARQEGVFDAHFSADKSRLMLVDYDPARISSFDILARVNAQNVHAARIS